MQQSQTCCARQKDDLHSVKLFFVQAQVFEEALNTVKFLGWLKKFGPSQNILGPVKGQGLKGLSKFDKNKFKSIAHNSRSHLKLRQ